MSDTGPGELTTKEAEKIAAELESRLRGEYPAKKSKRHRDDREEDGAAPNSFMEFIRLWSRSLGTLAGCGFLGWLAHTTFTMAGDVRVLLDRPLPVPMEQYRIDQRELKDQLAEQKRQTDDKLDAMQNRLNTLKPQK